MVIVIEVVYMLCLFSRSPESRVCLCGMSNPDVRTAIGRNRNWLYISGIFSAPSVHTSEQECPFARSVVAVAGIVQDRVYVHRPMSMIHRPMSMICFT